MALWKHIAPGYEVSDEGQVRSFKNARWGLKRASRVLKPWITGFGYEQVTLMVDGKKKHFLVHRLVCEAFHGKPKPGQEADHKDRNPINNLKENLHWTSRSQNHANSPVRQKTRKCRYKGIYKHGQRYVAEASVNNQTIYLGTYDTQEEAAKAYDRHARRWGRFAYLNFPDAA